MNSFRLTPNANTNAIFDQLRYRPSPPSSILSFLRYHHLFFFLFLSHLHQPQQTYYHKNHSADRRSHPLSTWIAGTTFCLGLVESDKKKTWKTYQDLLVWQLISPRGSGDCLRLRNFFRADTAAMHSLNTAMASSSGGDAFEERCKFNVDVEPGLREINSIPCGICQSGRGGARCCSRFKLSSFPG